MIKNHNVMLCLSDSDIIAAVLPWCTLWLIHSPKCLLKSLGLLTWNLRVQPSRANRRQHEAGAMSWEIVWMYSKSTKNTSVKYNDH